MSAAISTPVNGARVDDALAQYLNFMLGDEVFAMDIRNVREIVQHAAITTVPQMPDFVRGVINLRGSVVPVIDLQARFGRARARQGEKTCIVIFDLTLATERFELGLLVDSVNEVLELSASAIEEAPQFGATIAREFIFGIGKVGSRFITIIHPERALDIDDMAALIEQHQLR